MKYFLKTIILLCSIQFFPNFCQQIEIKEREEKIKNAEEGKFITQVPPIIQRKYEQLIDKLSKASELTDALKSEILDLFIRLTGRKAAIELSNLSQLLYKKFHTTVIHQNQFPAPVKAELLSLDDNDPLSLVTFQELIDQQKQNSGIVMIVRVVTSNPNGTKNVHYFDPSALNQWRFGKKFSLMFKRIYGDFTHPKNSTNPLNRLPINSIEYFTMDPNFPQEGFIYRFSENDLLLEYNLTRFAPWFILASNDTSAYDKILAGYEVAQELFRKHLTSSDFDQILRYFKHIAEQNEKKALKIAAIFHIGKIYSLKQNYEEAIKYLKQVAEQTAYQEMRNHALLALGEIYYLHQDDDEQALISFKRALITINPHIRIKIYLYLADMYRNGNGVKIDYEQAYDYCRQAFNLYKKLGYSKDEANLKKIEEQMKELKAEILKKETK